MYARRKPRPEQTERTRQQIVGTVRELLEEGTFHESTVEEVASRAGVSRATLYHHFGSRLGLVDAICEFVSRNPALTRIRELHELDAFIEQVVELCVSEEKVFAQLYGAAAVDPAAQDFVERQRRDRYGEVRRLLKDLGVTDGRAVAYLGLLTSFETFEELYRQAGLGKREVTRTLQDAARALLASP